MVNLFADIFCPWHSPSGFLSASGLGCVVLLPPLTLLHHCIEKDPETWYNIHITGTCYLVSTRGFEPPAYRLGGGRSILLSYVDLIVLPIIPNNRRLCKCCLKGRPCRRIFEKRSGNLMTGNSKTCFRRGHLRPKRHLPAGKQRAIHPSKR